MSIVAIILGGVALGTLPANNPQESKQGCESVCGGGILGCRAWYRHIIQKALEEFK